jgi:hypothetical protein
MIPGNSVSQSTGNYPEPRGCEKKVLFKISLLFPDSHTEKGVAERIPVLWYRCKLKQ